MRYWFHVRAVIASLLLTAVAACSSSEDSGGAAGAGGTTAGDASTEHTNVGGSGQGGGVGGGAQGGSGGVSSGGSGQGGAAGANPAGAGGAAQGGSNPGGAGGTDPGGAGGVAQGGSNPGGAGGTDPGGAGGSPPQGGSAGEAGMGGSAAGAGGSPTTCSSGTDCEPGWICEKTSCSAATGMCLLRPSTCNNEYEPSCGCNGVSYWNTCERQRAAVAATSSTMGRCGSADALHCATDADCTTADGLSKCVFVAFNSSGCSTPTNACWYLPSTCPATSYEKVRRCWDSQCLNICEGLLDSLNLTTYAYDSTCQ